MISSPDTRELLEKLRELSQEKIAEVRDFVDFLHERERRGPAGADERLGEAIRGGRVSPAKAGAKRSSVAESPPVTVPGRPASEIVIEDRR